MTNNNSTEMAIGSEHLDLAGNLIIKARFNNNFKKTIINNDELTYDELILMLQRLFNGKFDAKDNVRLKYRDEDGDLVDIDNDYDLKSAIQSNRYLKLVISLGEDEDDVSLLDDRVSLSKKEFRKLTETMQKILENLKTNEPVKPENSTNSSFEPLNNDAPVHHGMNNLNLYDSKEFDTLVNKTDDLKSEKSTVVQEEESIKSLNSSSLQPNLNQQAACNERQPATLQPSAQQFQSTQNLQSKILNQSQQQYPPMLSNQQTMMPESNQQTQQQQNPPQNQQQNQMPYRYGMPPSNLNQPPNNRPNTFNPNEMPGGSHPPLSSYPTPSSTPANTYGMNPQLMNQSQLASPPQSNPLQSGPTSAFNVPPVQNQPQLNRPIGPPPTGPIPQQANRPINQGPQQNGPPNSIVPPSNAPLPPQANLQGPPQFTNFIPPTGPYPGQQAPKGNPFSRNGQQARYAYPQQQQFN